MEPESSVKTGALFMLVTLIPYVIVQSVGFTNVKGEGPSHSKVVPEVWTAMIISAILFIV